MPSCGAWLGASTAAKSGKLDSADYAIGLNEYEAVAGNAPDILHFYKSGCAEVPDPDRDRHGRPARQAAQPAVLQLEAHRRHVARRRQRQQPTARSPLSPPA